MLEYFLFQEGAGKKLLLSPDQNRFVIGRSKNCDIVFSSIFVSRRHCEILRIPPRGSLIIKNLSRQNSTNIDSFRLTDTNTAFELNVGSLIGLGVPTNLFAQYKDDPRCIYLRIIREDASLLKADEEDGGNGDLANLARSFPKNIPVKNECEKAPSGTAVEIIDLETPFDTVNEACRSMASSSKDPIHKNSEKIQATISSECRQKSLVHVKSTNEIEYKLISNVDPIRKPINETSEDHHKDKVNYKGPLSPVFDEAAKVPPPSRSSPLFDLPLNYVNNKGLNSAEVIGQKQNFSFKRKVEETFHDVASKRRCISLDGCGEMTSKALKSTTKLEPFFDFHFFKGTKSEPDFQQSSLDLDLDNHYGRLLTNDGPSTSLGSKQNASTSTVCDSVPEKLSAPSLMPLCASIDEASSPLFYPPVRLIDQSLTYSPNNPKSPVSSLSGKPCFYASSAQLTDKPITSSSVADKSFASPPVASKPNTSAMESGNSSSLCYIHDTKTMDLKIKKIEHPFNGKGTSPPAKPSSCGPKTIMLNNCNSIKGIIKPCYVKLDQDLPKTYSKCQGGDFIDRNKSEAVRLSSVSSVNKESDCPTTFEDIKPKCGISFNEKVIFKNSEVRQIDLFSSILDGEQSTESIETRLAISKINTVKRDLSTTIGNFYGLEKKNDNVFGVKNEVKNYKLNSSITPIEIKQENSPASIKMESFDYLDDEDDDVVCYSQMDDVIYISSDDESNAKNDDISFGPLSVSPEPDLINFEENSMELIGAPISEDNKADSPSLFIDDDDDDDDIFLIERRTSKGSDIFTNDKDEPDTSHGDSLKGHRLSPSKVNQGQLLSLDKIKDLNEVIGKIEHSHKETGKVVLTEPVAMRSKRKMGKPRKHIAPTAEEICWSSGTKLSRKATVLFETSDVKKCHRVLKPHNKVSHKKKNNRAKGKHNKNRKGGIRDTILKTFDLHEHQAMCEGATRKERHHIRHRKDEPGIIKSIKISWAPDIHQPDSSKVDHTHKEPVGSTESELVAKINKVTKSEKITLKTALLKKYKIPRRDTMAKNDSPVKTGLHFASVIDTKLVETHTSVEDSETLKEAPANKKSEQLKSILRTGAKGRNVPRYNVHFPTTADSLCKVLPISPRSKNAKGMFSGPSKVRMKETFSGRAIQVETNFNPNEFIYNVCNWNYDWFSTYHKARQSSASPNPPKVSPNLTLPTLIAYRSYSDYKEVFSTLMYYEVWENLYRDWNCYSRTNNWFPSQITVIHTDIVQSGFSSYKFLNMKVILPITREVSIHNKHPTKGSLVGMKYKQNEKTIFTLGYVENFEKKIGSKFIPQDLKILCQNNENNVLLLNIRFSKGHLETTVKIGMVVYISNVSYIKPSVRAYDGLCNLTKSKLSPFILNPSNLTFFEGYGHCKEYIMHELPLNETQKNVVIKASDKCLYNICQPKVSVIQGPPGTGKTSVIVAIISQIIRLFKEKNLPNRRILVCAPSNAGVDIITQRLMKLKDVNIYLNIVRVGVQQSFSKAVRECTFHFKVQKEYDRRTSLPQNNSLILELKEKKAMALKASEEYEKALKEMKSEDEVESLRIRMTELLRSEQQLKERSKLSLSRKEEMAIYDSCKKKVLMQAEVVACTLTSCLSGTAFEIFMDSSVSWACCIIDEAAQCKETETWLPLQLGIKKLILVGDHMQLPATILSKVAHGKKLHQSLFERIYHHVIFEQNRADLIDILDVQYRMHPEICSWPSRTYYSNDLKTASQVTEGRLCNLKPYVILDLEDSREVMQNPGEIYNMAEVQAVVSLISCIAKDLRNFSVGVLTPYQQQKIFLVEKLNSFLSKHEITVSTIDNFQGQERDIIICSFVRANSSCRLGFVSNRQRLNVALTRAKKCLFIITNIQSMSSNKDWLSLIQDGYVRKVILPVNSSTMTKDNSTLYESLHTLHAINLLNN